MKNNKILPLLTIFFIVAVIVVLFLSLSKSQNMIVIKTGNIEQKPLPITLGKYQDSDCGMVIDNMNYTSQVISKSGKTWFFHDHGGMVNWIKSKPFKDEATIWVHSLDTNKWIDGRSAWYSRDEKTPMMYGFGAYENQNSRENLIPYEQMFLHMVRGEHMGNPQMQHMMNKESH